MCRLLTWVSRTPRTAREVLGEEGLEALRRLSRLHADGWGLAVEVEGRLLAERSTRRADTDAAFAARRGRQLLPNDHVLVVRRDTLAVELRPLSAQLGRRSAAA
jgi:predicted glutamine amidotransferase